MVHLLNLKIRNKKKYDMPKIKDKEEMENQEKYFIKIKCEDVSILYASRKKTDAIKNIKWAERFPELGKERKNILAERIEN